MAPNTDLTYCSAAPKFCNLHHLKIQKLIALSLLNRPPMESFASFSRMVLRRNKANWCESSCSAKTECLSSLQKCICTSLSCLCLHLRRATMWWLNASRTQTEVATRSCSGVFLSLPTWFHLNCRCNYQWLLTTRLFSLSKSKSSAQSLLGFLLREKSTFAVLIRLARLLKTIWLSKGWLELREHLRVNFYCWTKSQENQGMLFW